MAVLDGRGLEAKPSERKTDPSARRLPGPLATRLGAREFAGMRRRLSQLSESVPKHDRGASRMSAI